MLFFAEKFIDLRDHEPRIQGSSIIVNDWTSEMNGEEIVSASLLGGLLLLWDGKRRNLLVLKREREGFRSYDRLSFFMLVYRK
jgi:hypothetical protein